MGMKGSLRKAKRGTSEAYYLSVGYTLYWRRRCAGSRDLVLDVPSMFCFCSYFCFPMACSTVANDATPTSPSFDHEYAWVAISRKRKLVDRDIDTPRSSGALSYRLGGAYQQTPQVFFAFYRVAISLRLGISGR